MADAVHGHAGATAEKAVTDWRANDRLMVAWLLAIDIVALAVAFALGFWARFSNPLLPYRGPFSFDFYVSVIVWSIPLYLIVFALHHLYDPHWLFGGTAEYGRIVTSCTYGLIVLIAYDFLSRSPTTDISRGWLLAVWLFSILMVGVTRFSFRRVVYSLRRRGWFLTRALVVGTNEEARAVAAQIRENPASGLCIVGFVGEHLPVGEHILDDLNLVGGDADLPALIKELNIHEVIIAPTAISRARLLDLHRTFNGVEGVHLRLSSGLFEIMTTGLQVHEVGNVPLITLDRLRIGGIDRLLKVMLDYGLAIPGLIVLAPILAVLALLVKVTSPGPIIHRRRVLGEGGRAFDAYKFRTMVPNADHVLAEMLAKDADLRQEYESGHKLKNDPRVTRIGRVLRRFSLDELPQIFNVLRGQMSVVGPRMITPDEAHRYGKWAINLLTVKPGITGPWQVMGRNDLPYDERVRLSMSYIRNYSIWTDLKIILQTVVVVVTGRGAY